ncbi:MAG TPA: polysaccharide biosynthesis tyrosine autokinase, partial [Pyrinomonadaceae bacterium]
SNQTALVPGNTHHSDALAPPLKDTQYGYGVETFNEAGGSGYARLQEYWRSIRKHLWLILGIVSLITVLAAIYMARQPDIYEAYARVQVDLELNNPAMGAMKTNSVILNTQYQDPTYFNTQLQILSSAGLLSRVIKTLDLEHNQAFLRPQSTQKRSTWESLKRMVGLGNKDQIPDAIPESSSLTPSRDIAPATAREDLVEINRIAPYVEILQSGLTVKQLNETRIIEIRYRHLDPEVATKIINSIADTFVLNNLERKTETSSSAGYFLQKRIAELQSEIRTGEEQLINYAKNHQILSLDASQNTVVDRLSGLNRQLLEAENDRKLAEAAYRAALAPGAASALAEGGSNKQMLDAESKLTELRQKRAQLLVEYTEKYPEVKELDLQIAILEKQIKDTKSRATTVVTTNLETQYRQALAREHALRADFNRQRAETLTQNEAAVNYRIIQQEIETNKTLLDGLLQRAKENDVVLAGTPNNIHVLDYAPRPKAPIGPKRMQGVMLAALLSLVLGIAFARYLDYLDDSVSSVDDVEKTLHLPALAVIPAIGRAAKRRFVPAIGALQKRNGDHGRELLLVDTDGRSPLAEAFRQLRTSVLLSSAGGAPKTLLVTSSQPAEGKTTTAVNTATILAQTGANVLILDADMRRPRLHSIFGLENRVGLSTILANKMSEAEMLALVHQHEESGLYVLTSGAIPPNPAELLGSEQMYRLIAALEGTFTHIIIDSPPVASFTDGVLLSSMADGVLLVVHGGRASRAVVRRSRQLLQDVGAKIFGVVLNNVNLRSQDYYYYQHYNEHYYSKTEVDADTAA